MPTITCPASYIYKMTSDEPTSIDYTGHEARGTDNDQAALKVTYEPPSLDVTSADVGRPFVVTAIATDIDGNTAACQFMVFVEDGMYDTTHTLYSTMSSVPVQLNDSNR